MKIKFCGATKTVTGSNYLIEVNNQKILLECGLFQGGKKQELYKLNKKFLYDPREIDALVLSHAHIDHSGRIPLLVKKGFEGPVICTTPTVDICEVLLKDSAYLQKQDANFRRRHFKEKSEPLYSLSDVQKTMTLFRGYPYKQKIRVADGVTATFYDAGHVFGSAQVLLEIDEDQHHYTLAFTGDYGRKYLPILNDPYQIKQADILITESTYASHVHDSFSYVFEELEWIVNDVVARGGKIIIPGFSLERTQEIVYVLHKLYEEKKIPQVPIFVDSPMSSKISKLFMKFTDYYDNESFRDFLNKGKSPFAFTKLKYITKKQDSKKLNYFDKPCIIISASGMATGGRILHHLRNNISDKRNLILVVGYMAHGTLGRRLVEQKRKVRIFGEYYDLKADVVALNEFSAHADKLELLENIKNINGLRQVFIVHGEELEASVLRDNIYNVLKFKGRVDIPDLGEEFLIYNGNVKSKFKQKVKKSWQTWQRNRDVKGY